VESVHNNSHANDYSGDFKLRRSAALLSVILLFVINGVPLDVYGISSALVKGGGTFLIIAFGAYYSLKKSTWSTYSVDRFGLVLLMLLLVAAVASISWTIDATSTQLEILVWLYIFSIALILAPFSIEQGLTIFVTAFFVICLFSIFAGLAGAPVFMDHQGAQRFQGILFGPHAFARPATLCVIILVSGVVTYRPAASIFIGIFIVACLVLTLSRQAYIATLVGATLVLYFRLGATKRGWTLLVAVFAVAGFVVLLEMLGLLSTETVSRGEGDDITSFTGRTFIWAAAVQLIGENPIGGMGFGAGGIALQQAYATATSGWSTFNAHNGFLQAGMDLGAIGVALLVTMIAVVVKKVVASRKPYLFALLISMLLITFVERGIYGNGGMLFGLFTYMLVISPSKYTDSKC